MLCRSDNVSVLTYRLHTSDQLMAHLRPFAEEGKVVTEADIRAFFQARQNGTA